MCEIPNYEDGVGVCEGGYSRDIEELAGIVLNSGKKDKGGCGGVLGDD
jgi:hypothetical protein